MMNKRGQAAWETILGAVIVLLLIAGLAYLLITTWGKTSTTFANLDMSSVNLACGTAADTQNKPDWCYSAKSMKYTDDKGKSGLVYGSCEAFAHAAPTSSFYSDQALKTKLPLSENSTTMIANSFTASWPTAGC